MIQYLKSLKINLSSTRGIHPAIRSFLIIVLVLGLFFRFVNIDRKIYWYDEVYTSLQLSGYTSTEMSQELRNGRVITVEDFQKYQYPNSDKSVADTIRSLAIEDSQHPPIYYVIAWVWVKCFGNSVAVVRSFSVFISLLAFPCLYWLCQELFESSLISWTAIALIAVSPFHVLYAQQARPYSLGITAILLSSAALLHAMRVKSKVSWLIYGATVSIGLYNHIFFGLVAIGHGIYVAVIERFRLSRTLVSYVFVSLASLLIFLPWLLVIINAPSKFAARSWANTKSSLLSSSTRWAGIFSRSFFDLGIGPDDSLKRQMLVIPFVLILVALIGYSLYFIYCKSPKKVWLFVFTLIGVTGIVFMVPDFVFGLRYGTTRFLTPCILGIQLSLAYLLVTQTTALSTSTWRKFWQIVTVIVISGGVLSCAISSQAEMWWSTGRVENKYTSQIAYIVNKANQPLVISDADLIGLQTLGYLLDPKVRLQLVDQSDIPEIQDGFSNVFLFYPSDLLRSRLEKKYNSKIKMIINEGLWELENRK